MKVFDYHWHQPRLHTSFGDYRPKLAASTLFSLSTNLAASQLNYPLSWATPSISRWAILKVHLLSRLNELKTSSVNFFSKHTHSSLASYWKPKSYVTPRSEIATQKIISNCLTLFLTIKLYSLGDVDFCWNLVKCCSWGGWVTEIEYWFWTWKVVGGIHWKLWMAI